MNTSCSSLPSKPHYLVLDGLRGVAAVMVLAFHVLEVHSTGYLDMLINHGYLAVDFFFLLSGFVIGYAYDDRWGNMSLGNFFKRRLIRLQPMVILGSLLGALFFYFQDSVLFPHVHEVSIDQLLLIMLLGCTLLPLPVSMDVRGWQEMHPLNGPAWSLFFEYIANVLYVLVVRRLPTFLLSTLVFLSAVFLLHLTLSKGDVIGGWSLNAEHMHIGFARLLYPFFAGLLMSRTVKLTPVKNGFVWCTLLLVSVLSVPRIGGEQNLWLNGLYEAGIIVLVFPLIVYLGAGAQETNVYVAKVSRFFGKLSYPLYITHYPLAYTYMGWVRDHKLPLSKTWPVALVLFFSALLLAYAAMRWYDEPVRNWLQKISLKK